MRVSTIKCFMLRCTFSSINIPIRHPVSAAYHFDTFLKKSVLYVILYRVWNNFFCGLCGRAYNLLPPDRPLLVFRHRLRGKPCVCVEDHHSLMGNLQHFVLMFWLSWSDRQKSLSFFFFFDLQRMTVDSLTFLSLVSCANLSSIAQRIHIRSTGKASFDSGPNVIESSHCGIWASINLIPSRLSVFRHVFFMYVDLQNKTIWNQASLSISIIIIATNWTLTRIVRVPRFSRRLPTCPHERHPSTLMLGLSIIVVV